MKFSRVFGISHFGIVLAVALVCFLTSPVTGYASTFDDFNDYLKNDLKLPDSAIRPTNQQYKDAKAIWEAAVPSYIQYRQGFINKGLITQAQELSAGVGGMPMSAWLRLDPTARTFNIDSSKGSTIEEQKQAGAKAKAAVEAAGGCTWNNFAFERCIWNPFIAGLGALLIFISAMFLALADMLFNWSVDNTILLFSTKIFQSVQGGIELGWTAMRDIANIVIIGMFTFIAISTILSIQEYGAKKLLARVLIIAVLINFSLLFTKVIIDASNFTATQFYTNAFGYKTIGDAQTAANARSKGKQAAGTIQYSNTIKDSDLDLTTFQNKGIAGAFIGFLGVTSVSNSYDALKGIANDTTRGWYIALAHGILAFVLLGATGLVLFYGAYLLISRAVLFIFLMITAAGAFATHLIPKVNDSTYGWNGWWSSLLHNAALAPFLMIFLWITIKVSANVANKDGLLGNLVTGNAASTDIGALFNYVIILGLLWGSFKLSSKWASKVGGLELTGSILSSFAVAPIAGLSRFALAPALRTTLGKGAMARSMTLGENIKDHVKYASTLDKSSDEYKKALHEITGKMKERDKWDKLAKGSFNLPNTKLAQTGMKALGIPGIISGLTSQKKPQGYSDKAKEQAEHAIKAAEKLVLKKEDIGPDERARIRRAIVHDRQNSQNLRALRAAAVGLRGALDTALSNRTTQKPGKQADLTAAQTDKSRGERDLTNINQERSAQIPLVTQLKVEKGNADANLNLVQQEAARKKSEINQDSAQEITNLRSAAAAIPPGNATQLTAANQAIAEAQTRQTKALDEQDAKIRDAQARATDLGTRVTTEEGKLNTLNTQANAASNTVATATSTIKTLETDIKGLDDAVVKAEAKIKESDKKVTEEKTRMLKRFKESVDNEVEVMVGMSKGLAADAAAEHVHHRYTNMLNRFLGQTEDGDTMARFTRKQAGSSPGIKYRELTEMWKTMTEQVGAAPTVAPAQQSGNAGGGTNHP